MYFVYVLENREGKRYTGNTNNVQERLRMHNCENLETARFHRTTYCRGPWKVIFCKEFPTRLEAQRYEKFLKSGAGRRWLKIYLRD